MMSRVNDSSSSRNFNVLRCVGLGWLTTRQALRSDTPGSTCWTRSTHFRRREGLRSFPLPLLSGSACLEQDRQRFVSASLRYIQYLIFQLDSFEGGRSISAGGNRRVRLEHCSLCPRRIDTQSRNGSTCTCRSDQFHRIGRRSARICGFQSRIRSPVTIYGCKSRPTVYLSESCVPEWRMYRIGPISDAGTVARHLGQCALGK